MYELNVPADKPPPEEKPEAPLLSLFSSFGSKVSATAQAYAPVIKTTVSSTLERAEALVQREKEAFVLEQKRTTVPTPQALEAEESVEVLPWSNLPPAQAEQLKRQVMMLSHEKWNFMSPLNRDEPHGFEPYMVGQAKALLAVDPELNKMRFLLVPTKVKEEPFWANYFSRVRFLKTTLTQPQTPQTPQTHAPPPASAAASAIASTNAPPHAPLAAPATSASAANNATSAAAVAAATPPASVSVSVSGLNSTRAANAVPPARPKAPATAHTALAASPVAPSHMQPATAAVSIATPAAAAAAATPSVSSPPHSTLSISSDPTHVPLPGLSPAAQAAAAAATASSSPVSIVTAGQSPHSGSVTPASLATRAPPPTPQSPASPLGGTDDSLLTLEADAALAGDEEGEVALVDIDELEQSIDAILGLGAPKAPKT